MGRMSDTVQAALIGAAVASILALLTVITERWKFLTTASVDTAARRRETMFSVAHRAPSRFWALPSPDPQRPAGQGPREGTGCRPRTPERLSSDAQRTDKPTDGPAFRSPHVQWFLSAEAMHDSHHRLINSAMGRMELITPRRQLQSGRLARAQGCRSQRSACVAHIDTDCVLLRLM